MKFLAKAIIFLILFGISAVTFLALSEKTQAADEFCVARIVVKTNVETWMEVDGKSLNLYSLYTQRDTTINQTNDNASTHKVEVYTNEWQDDKFVGKSFESNFEVKDFECFASSSDWSLDPVPTTTLSIDLDAQKMEISVTPGSTTAPTTEDQTGGAGTGTDANSSTGSAPSGNIAGESAIRAALRTGGNEHSGWVITAWKIVLGLANLGLVVILIFLAVVNILRIQYDTYAIKKSLPILIIGIILANFSLLIVRMLVDFSNILTNLFTNNQSPGQFASNLIAAANVGPGGEIGAAFASGGIGLGTLLLWFLFALFVMVAFLILGFLFYIRFAVVLILAIVAPLAFVAMAFPPTQGFFKQWWGWLVKFIFMKPIVFFLLYLAMQIRTAEDSMGHLTAWFIIAFLVYLALIIPFKLGGAVMGAWSNAGKFVTGTGKGGYIRKPLANWAQRRYQGVGTWFTNRFPGIAGRSEWDKERTELKRKRAVSKARRRVEGKMGGRQATERELTREAEENLKMLQAEHQLGVRTGTLENLKNNWWWRKLTGAKDQGQLAMRLAKTTVDMQKKVEAVNKADQLDLFAILSQATREDKELRDYLQKMLDAKQGLEDLEVEEDGTISYKPGEINTTWRDYRHLADVLRLSSKTEADPDKARRLFESASELDQKALAWQQANPTFTRENGETVTLDYDKYLNRNLEGRHLKLLTPPLIEEGHTLAQNDNIQAHIDALFGNKGGGFGYVRYTGDEAVQDFVNRRYGPMGANEINGVVAQMIGAKERMSMNPELSDAQEFMVQFLEGMTQDDYLGPELWRSMLQKIENDRTGSLGQFVIEYSKDQKKRGEKSIIEDCNSDRYRGDEGISHLNEDYPDLINQIPVEVIGKLVPTARGGVARHQSELFRRIRTQIMQMPEFGGGKNPALFAGEVTNQHAEKFSTLKSTGGGGRPPEGTPDFEAQNNADARQASDLWTQDYDQLESAAGGIGRVVEKYADGIRHVFKMRASLEGQILPGDVKVDYSGLEDIIGQIAGANPDLSSDDLETQLRATNPNITLDRNLTVRDLVTRAQEVRKADDNINQMLLNATAQDYVPYAQAAPQNAEQLNKAVSSLEGAAETLAGAAEKLASTEGKEGLDAEGINKIIQTIEQSRGGDIKINTDALRSDLSNNDVERTSDLINKLLVGFRANQFLRQVGQPISESSIKKAIISGFNEAQLKPEGTPTPPPPATPSQPAPPPPPTEQPPGGGDVPPVGTL